MPAVLLRGGEALARGALAAGVQMVTSYPGSPSSEVVEALVPLAEEHALQVEWASNERVALEIGIGVSIAGGRALVCTKSVGMNVMLDPLMALNLTPPHGGLVIVLGDDPGGYGSQNDQHTRALAPLLELPMFEPSSPAGAFALIQEAFSLAERFQLPVILRETRGFSQVEGWVDVPDGPFQRVNRGCAREPWRFVPVPRNVVAKHRALHERLGAFTRWAEESPPLRTSGAGELGLCAAGFAAAKLADVLGENRIVAPFGDSAFFHSALPALCHAVVARGPILMIVLDNQSTLTSGNQPHPGVGRDALGRPAPKLSIERIARARDVPLVKAVSLDRADELRQALGECWSHAGPALMVVEIPRREQQE